jgi:hypothetical protein
VSRDRSLPLNNKGGESGRRYERGAVCVRACVGGCVTPHSISLSISLPSPRFHSILLSSPLPSRSIVVAPLLTVCLCCECLSAAVLSSTLFLNKTTTRKEEKTNKLLCHTALSVLFCGTRLTLAHACVLLSAQLRVFRGDGVGRV